MTGGSAGPAAPIGPAGVDGIGLYLLDSSAWIPLLRRPRQETSLKRRVDELLAANAVATTGVVRLELLRGASDWQHLEVLRARLTGLHQLPTDELTFDEAGRLGLQLRLLGLSLQGTDLIIAAVALRAGATILHRDRDFDAIARHSPLLVESYV
jgi:predicted nucleic acid-binding protein